MFGLTVDAGKDHITSTYKKLAKLYHPNKHIDCDQRCKTLAEENFKAISNAYKLLNGTNSPTQDQRTWPHKYVQLQKGFLSALTSENVPMLKDLVKNLIDNIDADFRDETSQLLLENLDNRWSDLFRRLLQEEDRGSKVDFNVAVGSSNDTALIRACKNNEIGIIKLLLEYRADVNKANLDHETPLYFALKHNNSDLVSLLFEHGGKVSTKCEQEIIDGILRYKKETIEVLLQYTFHEQNIGMLKRFSDNMTLKSEDIEIAELLLYKVVDQPNAMKIVADIGNSKLIELFDSIRKKEEFYVVDIKTLDKLLNTLKKAINNNDYGELDEVIGNDQDCESITDLNSDNFKDFCSKHLNLDLQKRSDHKHIYDNILSKYKLGTESDNCDYSAKKLMLLAIAANDKLIEKYRSTLLNQEDLELESLLLLVGGQKYIDILSDKLKEKDNGVKAVSHKFFQTIALREEFNQLFTDHITEYLKTLEKSNVVGTIRNILNAASSVKNEECIKTVLSSSRKVGVDNANSLYLAALYSKETAQAFLNTGVCVDNQDDDGMTPLHFIARDAHQTAQKDGNGVLSSMFTYVGRFLYSSSSSKDNDDVIFFRKGIEFLLSEGADIDVKDNNGKTPLHFAICNGNLEIVKFLVKGGADFNIAYENGTVLDLARSSRTENKEEVIKFFEEEVEIEKKRTPLHYAVLNDNSEVLRFLLEKKHHDVNAKDSDNYTPLGLAIRGNRLKAVKLLLDYNANVDCECLEILKSNNAQAGELAYLLVNKLEKELAETKAKLGQGNGDQASQVGKLKEKLKKTEAELAEKDAQLRDVQARSEQEKTKLQDGLKKKEEALGRIQVELKAEEEKFAKKEKELNGVQAEKDEALKRVQTQLLDKEQALNGKEEEISQLKQDLEQAKQNADASKAEKAQFAEEKKQLQADLNDKTSQVTMLTKERNRLEQELKEADVELTRKANEMEEKSRLEEKLNSEITKLGEKSDRTKAQLKKLQQDLNERTSEAARLAGEKSQLEKEQNDAQQGLAEKNNELESTNQKVLQLEQERDSAKQDLTNTTGEVTQLTEENTQLKDNLKATTEKNVQLQSKLESTRKTFNETVTQLTEENTKLKNELKLEKPKSNDLKTKLQESESKSKGLESRIENLQKQLESKNKELNGKNEKFLGASTNSKRQGNYASVSFVLSGAFAVGASLTISYLAICIALAVAALTFLTVGCYCSYKANTALSNVEVDNCVNLAVVEV